MRIVYETKKYGAGTLNMIATINDVLDRYAAQGYDLTLRQLYYQIVAADLFPDDRTWSYDTARKKWLRDPNGTKNAEPNYKWLGGIVNDGRLTGHIDWDRIVDRTRDLEEVTHWADPAEIVEATARSFRMDLWDSQPTYVEVWIEKDALTGVIEGVCREMDVPYFSCRGYTSQSEMWGGSQRLLKKVMEGKRVTILHLGDHDPSGIDMTRDIRDRLHHFVAVDAIRRTAKRDDVQLRGMSPTDYTRWSRPIAKDAIDRLEIRRIALTMDQVETYQPPPNPAKQTDSRFQGYIEEYGDESWELDALEPAVMNDLIREHIEGLIEDQDGWDEAAGHESDGQRTLRQVSAGWDRIVEGLNGKPPDGQ